MCMHMHVYAYAYIPRGYRRSCIYTDCIIQCIIYTVLHCIYYTTNTSYNLEVIGGLHTTL